MLSQTVPAGRVTRMCHDKANRLLEKIYPDTTPADDSDNRARVTSTTVSAG